MHICLHLTKESAAKKEVTNSVCFPAIDFQLETEAIFLKSGVHLLQLHLLLTTLHKTLADSFGLVPTFKVSLLTFTAAVMEIRMSNRLYRNGSDIVQKNKKTWNCKHISHHIPLVRGTQGLRQKPNPILSVSKPALHGFGSRQYSFVMASKM